MKLSARLAVVLVLSLAGALVAASLLLQHHGEALGTSAVAELCGAGPESGCDTVNRSAWAEIAGIPWAALGLTFYLSMAALMGLALLTGDLARRGAARAAFYLFAAGLATDLVLFGIQAFRIHAYCKLCLLTYALNAIALGLLWPLRSAPPASVEPPAEGAVPVPAAEPSTARLVVAAWAIATLAFLGGVWASEGALAQREKARAASILGTPVPATVAATPAPPPEPVATLQPTPEAAAPAAPPASGDLKRYQEQLKAAQDEVTKLKAVLEDPQKYEAYQSEKSLRDFGKNPEQKIDLKDTPVKGPVAAPIKVVEYSDFLCPFCKQIAQAFSSYVGQSANRVAIYYKFYPLDSACNAAFPQGLHPGACWLAYGGVCAQEAGKFQAYHDKVFGMDFHGTTPDRQTVVKIGAELGLDASSFNSCIGSDKTKERVVADVTEGTSAGVQGTPTIFINRRRLPRSNEFLAAVDQESKRLKLGPMPTVQ